MTDYLEIQNTLLYYYSNLLIVKYNGKPKATAFIKLLTKMILANMIIMQIRDGFDWKTAIGKQLDIIGDWVGVSRNYNANNSWNNTYLSYPSYGTETTAEDDPQRGGYSDYYTFDYDDATVAAATNAYIVENETAYSSTWLSDTDGGDPITPTVGTFYKVLTEGSFENKVYCWNNNQYELYFAGGVLTYKDIQSDSQKLNDDDFRLVIGLKIIKNSINHICGEIDKAIYDYFNQAVYTTWEIPHVVTYHYPQSLSTIINICLSKGVLLAPTGVEIQLSSY